MAAIPDLSTIWSAAGVIAGFQVAAFTWRISREIQMSDSGEATWLPLADLLNILSLAVNLLGVFVAPVLGIGSEQAAGFALGWATLLLMCWPTAVAAHCELFNRRPRTRPAPYAPRQERVVGTAIMLSLLYWLIALL